MESEMSEPEKWIAERFGIEMAKRLLQAEVDTVTIDLPRRRAKLCKRLGISATELHDRLLAHMRSSGARPHSAFERKVIEHVWLADLERSLERELHLK